MAVNEWDRRELCPDGTCTGVIGPEGTCKVCGHAAQNWGDERKRGTVDEADDDVEDDDDAEDEVPDPIAPATKVEIGGGEWHVRQLCSDGGCTGVIGANGKCKVCGKPGTGAVAVADDELADDEEWDDSDDEADDDAELEAAADELAGIKPVGAAAAADDDESHRKFCPDGGCIGVIGADGKCKVCGKEAA
jgi:hypothetical protein